MKNNENLNVSGHLEIYKVYDDGNEELVFDEANTITSGMGVGLSYFFTGSGSKNIMDYQIDRFQIGVSGPNPTDPASSIFALSGALETLEAYGGTSSKLILEEHKQVLDTAIDVSPTNKVFAVIPAKHVSRLSDTGVRYMLVLDEEACISADVGTVGSTVDVVAGPGKGALNEVALFMKNPMARVGDNASIMVAYRTFSDIVKTNDFSLVFRWNINF